MSDPQQPSTIDRIAGLACTALLCAATIMWIVSAVRPGPPDPPTPSPTDEDIPAVVSAAEADCEAFAEMVHGEIRIAKRKRSGCTQIRNVMPDKIRGSFSKLGEQFQFADDAQFVGTLRSAASGLVHASDQLRQMRKDESDDAIADYYAELSPNFRTAADQFAKHNVHEQRIHDELKRANTQASQRLIDALCHAMGERSFSGYLIDQEHREELRQTSNSQLNLMMLAEGAPKEIDPRGWHQIEDQLQISSCQGHALTSVCENAYIIAAGGRLREPIQFSPMFAYLDSQKQDKIFGRGDIGSTLAGGLASARNSGSCPLEVMPYPTRYTEEFAPGAYDAARQFLIRQHTWLSTYSDVKNYLASGLGGVEIGIRWGQGMSDSGVIEVHDSRGGGGHAVCFLGYTHKKTDEQGRPYLWLANSWGKRWGDQGWALVSPNAVDQMCRHPETVMLGLSDMSKKNTRKRDVSWMGPGSVFGRTKPSKQLAI